MAQLIPGLKSYFRPESLEEFQRLIQAHDEYKLLAGGTSLAFGLFKAKTVIDISGLPLSHIRQTETGDLEIGACATIYDLESSDASKHMYRPF